MGEHQGSSISTGGSPSINLRDAGDRPPKDAEHQQAPKEPHWPVCPHEEYHPYLHNSMGLATTETVDVVVHMQPESVHFLPAWVLTSSPAIEALSKPQLLWLWGRRRVKSLHRQFHRDNWGKMGTSETTPAICKANVC